MPAEFDRCVRNLMNDPDFKPREKGQSKKDAAYAVCTASYKKKYGKSPFSESQIKDLTLEELMKRDPVLALAVRMLDTEFDKEE